MQVFGVMIDGVACCCGCRWVVARATPVGGGDRRRYSALARWRRCAGCAAARIAMLPEVLHRPRWEGWTRRCDCFWLASCSSTCILLHVWALALSIEVCLTVVEKRCWKTWCSWLVRRCSCEVLGVEAGAWRDCERSARSASSPTPGSRVLHLTLDQFCLHTTVLPSRFRSWWLSDLL